MDEQASLRHVSPLIADAFDKVNASIVRLNQAIAAQNKASIISVDGAVTKKQLESILLSYAKKKDWA